MVPLNQTYRMHKTFLEYPNIYKEYLRHMDLSRESGFRLDKDGNKRYWGRTYDYALISSSDIIFDNAIVADLGARDGYFGAWLTQFAKQVYVSDYFDLWGKGTADDLGQLDYWEGVWTAMAPRPERLKCEHQDISNLDYPDDFFDVVICTSVIEHMHDNDTAGMKEIVRICKPGGTIAISTDMSELNAWYSGTFWYNEATLMERLIRPFPVEFRGPHDFSLVDPDNDAVDSIVFEGKSYNVMPVIFTLRKV